MSYPPRVWEWTCLSSSAPTRMTSYAALCRGRTSKGTKARNTRKLWDELLDEIINDRMSKQPCEHDRGNDDQDEMDFVDVLLLQERGITRDHLKAILVDMFQAGTETTSVVLVFAMAELMQKPHLMAKLQAELRTNIPK
ncbi:P450-like protein [Oryza sativa Japonica Group]|uniref:Os01g0544200 protein n=1 Tax=Oryza sativa subsp. japonica TaxID=39947 RepID=Q5JKB7_ORYSJ|nr:P450-like protein [Oryza sativa Japonica Group]BAH91132.1 Os01g0544200 [Oryza sativa Japonica Group]|eukprot:NP_001172402.1 Os01g0544200 [Oryza sativa Japonica Group]